LRSALRSPIFFDFREFFFRFGLIAIGADFEHDTIPFPLKKEHIFQKLKSTVCVLEVFCLLYKKQPEYSLKIRGE